jgi:hypothetical protein
MACIYFVGVHRQQIGLETQRALIWGWESVEVYTVQTVQGTYARKLLGVWGYTYILCKKTTENRWGCGVMHIFFNVQHPFLICLDFLRHILIKFD